MSPKDRDQVETHYYLESKKHIDELNTAIINMEKSEDFSAWLALMRLLSSMVGLLGVILSEQKETKTTVQSTQTTVQSNGHTKKEISLWKLALIQGGFTFLYFMLGWFFTEIAPRIFTIPHP